MTEKTPDRCRIVLIAPEGGGADVVLAALAGGDVASLIVPQFGLGEAAFQDLAEAVTSGAQARGVAVMIAGDSRVAGRVGADGIHVEGGRAALADAIDRLHGRMMVGAGGVKSRDEALDLGELGPDYLFLGRFGYDARPAAHPRNLALATWWSQMVEIPCVAMAGAAIDSVAEVAATGAEFAAVSQAVFAGRDPAAAVAAINRLLDERAPAFGAAQ